MRARFDFGNQRITAHQTTGVTGELGALGLSRGGTYGMESPYPDSTFDISAHFDQRPGRVDTSRTLLGVGGGFAAIGGVRGKIGFELVPENQSCE